jgi:hypothetical protein
MPAMILTARAMIGGSATTTIWFWLYQWESGSPEHKNRELSTSNRIIIRSKAIRKLKEKIRMDEKQEKLKKKHDRIREQVKAKEARRKQTDNFADIFSLQNNDFNNKFNNKFNGEKK